MIPELVELGINFLIGFPEPGLEWACVISGVIGAGIIVFFPSRAEISPILITILVIILGTGRII